LVVVGFEFLDQRRARRETRIVNSPEHRPIQLESELSVRVEGDEVLSSLESCEVRENQNFRAPPELVWTHTTYLPQQGSKSRTPEDKMDIGNITDA
jgi:hypothetical protein